MSFVCNYTHEMNGIEHEQTKDERPLKRVNFTLPPEVDDLLEARAKSERRSKSAHVAWLIERDAAGLIAEMGAVLAESDRVLAKTGA